MTTPNASYPNVYPALPLNSGDVVRDETKVYRLQKIEEIKSQIIREREQRDTSYKKLKRWICAISYVEHGVELLGAATAAVGIPAIAGIISAPIGFAMEGAAIGAFGCYALLKYASKRLTAKTRKHDQIRTLADVKLNTIDEYISKAIEDGDISHEEFVLINSELKKFNEMKEKIRAKTSTKLEEAKTMNKTDFERQVEERATTLAREMADKEKKELIKKLGE